MFRTESSISIPVSPEWVHQLLDWADQHFSYFSYLNPNDIAYPMGAFPHVFYAGNLTADLDHLDDLPKERPKIGIVSYDRKNRYENLHSQNPTWLECPETVFFSPEITIHLSANEATITAADPETCARAIAATGTKSQNPLGTYTLTASHGPRAYQNTFEEIQQHILDGDIYEMNFCMGFHGKLSYCDPVRFYLQLSSHSPMPFSALVKAKDLFLCCASPERFLKKQGLKLVSQPIKGSTRRGKSPEEDAMLRQSLLDSEKERAENLMIVDLMRNDLSRLAKTGTVSVPELFGIYSFRQITQMISTVACQLPKDTGFQEIISKTFPMGSMTGAPKIRCMELIEKYETFKRGWFSGCLVRLEASGDFDSCVIIRSMILNRARNIFYFGVGSAITADANAIDEYQECQLKASTIIQTLNHFYQQKTDPVKWPN
ncbi:para-aminobenzoate synthetase component 1 [Cyclobacterium lianum]|uniref:Para-aminobenzoate synthetase component 1 n=1 Tax=Cyclobacterium lianum TaxID=388280 RepID=A0A1M7P9F5_9BACT|nr:anthranilate synthase component I family protein [Cyclobacterium lianum]SHN13447.1 para-aminobenzoate synthetase component 1 [Cyclobacterium lianum]